MTDTRNEEMPPEFEREQPRRTTTPAPGHEDPSHAAGISNRPLEQEEENQDRLPPRGEERS
jgi:hypothetical protein